jgi:hypothetical protein
MTHDEANAAQRRIFAVDDLTKAARLIELSIGAFSAVDDANLKTAISYLRLPLDYHKAAAPKITRQPIPGDVP